MRPVVKTTIRTADCRAGGVDMHGACWFACPPAHHFGPDGVEAGRWTEVGPTEGYRKCAARYAPAPIGVVSRYSGEE